MSLLKEFDERFVYVFNDIYVYVRVYTSSNYFKHEEKSHERDTMLGYNIEIYVQMSISLPVMMKRE